MSVADLDDPRVWPAAAPAPAPFDAAERAIAADTQVEADAADLRVRQWLLDAVTRNEGDRLSRTLAHAPSPALARHVRRLLSDVEREVTLPRDALGTALFGYRQGDEVVWEMPGGVRRLRVEMVTPDWESAAAVLLPMQPSEMPLQLEFRA